VFRSFRRDRGKRQGGTDKKSRVRNVNTSYINRRKVLKNRIDELRISQQLFKMGSPGVKCRNCHEKLKSDDFKEKPEYSIIIGNSAKKMPEEKIDSSATHALFFNKLQKRNKKTLLRNLKLFKGTIFIFINLDVESQPYHKSNKKVIGCSWFNGHSSIDKSGRSLSIINMQ